MHTMDDFGAKRVKSNRHIASDPGHSVWVSANAGSGKTRVLTERVLRILLSRTPPSKILCLTYTKAAASEMKNRIYGELSKWVSCSDEELDKSLNELTAGPPSEKARKLARTLFATVVESPEGVRIQTIHSLCQSLLRRFPVEAGVPPHFKVLDEAESKELMEEARRQILLNKAGTRTDLGKALEHIAGRVSEDTFDTLLKHIVSSRRKLACIIQPPGGVENVRRIIKDNVLSRYEVDANTTRREWVNHIVRFEKNADAIRKSIPILLEGSKIEKDIAGELAAWWGATPEERSLLLDDYFSCFLTQDKKKEIKKKVRLCTDDTAKKYPHIRTVLEDEQERIFHHSQVLKSLEIIEHTEHAIAVADAILDTYRTIKERTGGLDFEDQIEKAVKLLTREGIASWVLYKLDGGLDHVLVDEAQDTSPLQWRLIDKLVDEFFHGESAGRSDRTLFVVGDDKQSIFSFQGAEPSAFAGMEEYFSKKITSAGKPYKRVPLEVSYRSAESVLAAVDAVFSDPAVREGVAMIENSVRHSLHRNGEAGRVELWDLTENDKQEEEEGSIWQAANGKPAVHSETKLARRIAATIRSWLNERRQLESKGRAVTPGDILILVKSRSRIVHQLLKALHREKIPVAGSDRLKLKEDVAVMDMLALFRFLLLPEDDMSLAIVLKSPLIGFGEEQLFELAYGRGELTLWQRLKAHENAKTRFGEAHGWLARALAMTDRVAPFELISLVLDSWEGRKHFIARLGEEAMDPLDELASLALTFDREHAPTLQGFLHWFESRDSEVKRDMEQEVDAVRIMTVHGAKGLQAPIVFLPDTTRSGKSDVAPLLFDEQDEWFVWAPSSEARDATSRDLIEQKKTKEAEESRRLMYVAMTRAEDELYVCGFKQDKEMPGDSWYNMISKGFSPIAKRSEKKIKGEQFGMQYTHNPQNRKIDKASIAAGAASPPATGLPEYFLHEPKPEPPLPRPLSPSQVGGKESALLSPMQDAQRILRGTLIHTLLQYLPSVAEEVRTGKARAYLALRCQDEDMRQSILQEVQHLLSHRIMKPFLSGGGISEAPISGVLMNNNGSPFVVSGQIDRLVVNDKEVWVLDYKTGRQVPGGIEDIPGAYITQMQLYRDLLRQIYPSKTVRCALLWTSGPALFELPDALMDAKLSLDAKVA